MKNHLRRGDKYAQKEQWDAAIQEYKQHAEIYPASSFIIFRAIGDIYHNQWKLDDAVTWYKKALKSKPNDEYITFSLGITYMHQEKYDEAVCELTKVLNTKPDDFYAHYGLGQTYDKQGKLKDAMQEYEKALKIDPDNDEVKISLDILKKRLSKENSKNAGNGAHPVTRKWKQSTKKSTSENYPSEEPQGKENLPPGSYWMEDPEFHKMLLKRRADSKGKDTDTKNLWQ